MTTHTHDIRERRFTKHPGSKVTAPRTPVKGQRVARRINPKITGVVTKTNPAAGTFAVTYDEGTGLNYAGRTFWFQSYQIGQFVPAPQRSDQDD